MLTGTDGVRVAVGNDWAELDGATPAEAPAVSVVVPYYDAQESLDLVLAALAGQTHPATRLQVVVADDGSPRPPRVPSGVVVVRQPDRGFRAAAARNLGAAAADGTVLCFLDADTVPEPGYVAALSALPGALPDALVTGRRRHADLSGWSPERLRAWFTGGEAPVELTEPAWLREAHTRTANLLRLDGQSHRYVISAVFGLSRDLFVEVGGFEASFVGYGGEDWELAHRLLMAGGVLAHRPAAVAWHDGPDWGERRHEAAAARAQKNTETRTLARWLPDSQARGAAGWWSYPEVVVRLEPGQADNDAVVLGVRSVLAAGLDAQVWTPAADLLDGDPRVHPGAPGPDVLARCRTQVDLTGPLLWEAGGLADLVGRVRPGGLGEVYGRVAPSGSPVDASTVDGSTGPGTAGPRAGVEVTVSATRALRRAARWAGPTGRDVSDLVTELFGRAEVEVPAVDPGAHPDLAHHLRRL